MLRCPESTYKGVGRLADHRWIINDRGYANVVDSNNSEDELYGLVYSITSSDEDILDRNEGVPSSYTKEMVDIDFWESKDGKAVDVHDQGVKKGVLVYIDRKRVTDDKPQEEYVHRMNMGIKDAVDDAGVPSAYVKKVMRPFIFEQGRRGLEKLAKQQALNFEDLR